MCIQLRPLVYHNVLDERVDNIYSINFWGLIRKNYLYMIQRYIQENLHLYASDDGYLGGHFSPAGNFKHSNPWS